MTLNKRTFVYILFFNFTIFLSYSQTYIQGEVTSRGDGVPNVQVTDGFTSVLTDDKGKYRFLTFQEEGFVYITTPSGYTIEKKENTIPLFFQSITEGKTVYNFELIPTRNDDKHTFFVQTDVQVSTEKHLTEGYKAVIKDIVGEKTKYKDPEIFGLDCGDIVGDNHALYPLYLETSKDLNFPVYRTIGNHDMDYYGSTHETSYKTFSRYFGPPYYSFNKGKAHYVLINNSFFIGRDYFYMGYIDNKTFNWLQQDLANVTEGSLVFIMMHIPARSTSTRQPFQYNAKYIANETTNAQALFNLLKPYNAHIITGHTHVNANVEHSENIFEHNTAAASGTWWQGDLCSDGAPRGYGVYSVDGNNVEWYYKSSGFPANYQFRAYPVGSSPEHPDKIIANVWNWDSAWTVEWLEDGVSMGCMTQYEGLDPAVIEMCKDKERITSPWIYPSPTKHLFHAVPNNKKSKLEIKVTDRFGNVYIQQINP